jgi:hypothetical protein
VRNTATHWAWVELLLANGSSLLGFWNCLTNWVILTGEIPTQFQQSTNWFLPSRSTARLLWSSVLKVVWCSFLKLLNWLKYKWVWHSSEVPDSKRSWVVSSLVSSSAKIWKEIWSFFFQAIIPISCCCHKC